MYKVTHQAKKREGINDKKKGKEGTVGAKRIEVFYREMEKKRQESMIRREWRRK